MKFCNFIIFSIVFSSSAVLHINAQSYTNVTLANGTVTGKEYTLGMHKGWEFLAIPFAEPPIGNLRFAKPQPIRKAWNTTLMATKPGKKCSQIYYQNPIETLINITVPMSEDCLILNIWTPYNASSTPRAVMVWIHGGGYYLGEAYPTYNGRAMAAMGDVVVVTIQYRLGVFGFLRLDSSVGGNWGLWDQQLALKWVSENIRQFGGDPSLVTIFGESAGAGSVGFQLLNPESASLFKRAIMQSGTPMASWSFSPDAQAYASLSLSFAAFAGCTGSTNAILQCLRNKNTSELVGWTSFIFTNISAYRPVFAPVLDGDFVKETPTTLLSSGRMMKKDLLIGINADEGGMLMYGIQYELASALGVPFATLETSPLFNMMIKYMYTYYPHHPNVTSTKAMEILEKHLISPNPSNGTANMMNINKAFSLSAFDCPANDMADAYANINSTVYFYQFTHRPLSSVYPSYIGSTHFDEVQFVFGIQDIYYSSVASANESALTQKMIADWSTFAKTGKPNAPDWMPYNNETRDYYKIDLKSGPHKYGVNRMSCQFWKSVLPTINSLSLSAKSRLRQVCPPSNCPVATVCEDLNVAGKALLAALCIILGLNAICIGVYCYRRSRGKATKHTFT